MSLERRETPTIVVVGAGIAGLSTAYLIRELGREAGRTANIILLESDSEAGGSTRTEIRDGYTCEWGPNGFLDNEPATFDLVQRVGLADKLVKADASSSRRFIYYGGKMRELPVTPPAFLMSNILPLHAKLRIAAELFVPAKRNGREETVYSFGRRRLGKSFADYLLDPMVSGIFAGDTAELSLPAVFPKMVEMEREYGGLIRAMIAKQREAKRTGKKSGGPAGAAATLHTFQNGMGELTRALAASLRSKLQTGSPVHALEWSGGGFTVRSDDRSIRADGVILACPSFVAAAIIDAHAPETANALRGIGYAPVEVVCHGHRAEEIGHSLNGFGVLIPRSEGIRSLGCLWCDSIFPGQAPAGRRLLRTLIGGAHDPSVTGLSETKVDEIATRDNAHLFDVKSAPEFRRVFRHAKGIAQYTLGHLDRVAASERLERELPGLFFTGASYRGVSVNGCAKDAFRVAREFWQQWSERI